MDEGAASSSAGFPLYRQQSVKRSFSAMTDDYRSSSPDSLFVPQDDQYDLEPPAQRRRTNHSRLVLPSRTSRFEGDGLDYRRPVMSGDAASGQGGSMAGRSAAVIDLTEDDDATDGSAHTASADGLPISPMASSRAQRLPRFSRNIIDVEGENEEEGQRMERQTASGSNRGNSSDHDFSIRRNLQEGSSNNQHPRFSILQRPQWTSQAQPQPYDMEDVEFLETRPRRQTRSASRNANPAAPMQRSITPYPTAFGNAIDLTGEDDDVVHIESRVRPRSNLERPVQTANVGIRNAILEQFPGGIGSRLLNRLHASQTILQQHIHNQHRDVGTRLNNAQNGPAIGFRFARPPDGMAGAINFMDYGAVAFDMGLEGGNRPPTPKYEAPEAAQSGFTRSPEEDQIIVCPNCGDELAMGETEEKQQVWVIKKCGHAYCGVCANNRVKASRSSKKGKGKAPVTRSDLPHPFSRCVVDGCNEAAAVKSMVHVFIGS